MRSKQLLDKLRKDYSSSYRISKLSGISESRLSAVKNKENRNFQADELLMLMNAKMINKTEMLKISFADRLKNDALFRNVASVFMTIGGLQFTSHLLETYNQLCILC